MLTAGFGFFLVRFWLFVCFCLVVVVVVFGGQGEEVMKLLEGLFTSSESFRRAFVKKRD